MLSLIMKLYKNWYTIQQFSRLDSKGYKETHIVSERKKSSQSDLTELIRLYIKQSYIVEKMWTYE